MTSNGSSARAPDGRKESVSELSLEQQSSSGSASTQEQLIHALLDGDPRLVRSLLRSGASVNACARDGKGSTSLHIAASLSSPECLVELVKLPEKPQFLPDANGDTPLHLCARRTPSIATLLLLVSIYGVVPASNARGDTFFHCLMENACVDEDRMIEVVQWLFDREDFVESRILNAINADGNTAYDVASVTQCGRVDLLQLLLNEGASTGNMLRSNQIVALIDDETAARASLCTNSEAPRRDKLLKAFLHYRRKLTRLGDKIRKTTEEESAGRAAYEEKEARHFKHLLDKCDRSKEAVLIRDATGSRASGTPQRIDQSSEPRAQLAVPLDALRENAPGPLAPTLPASADPSAAAAESERQVVQGIGAAAPTTVAAQEGVPSGVASPPAASVAREGTWKPLGLDHSSPMNGFTVTVSPAFLATPAAGVPRPEGALMTPNGSPLPEVATPDSVRALAELVLQRHMARRIGRAYASYRHRKATRAAVKVQACFRGYWIRANYHFVRAAIITIQRAWRSYSVRRRRARVAAVRVILSTLRRVDLMSQGKAFIAKTTAALQHERIRGVTQAVTQLVWRENFCSAFREIVFAEKRHKPPPPPRNQRRQRWWALTTRIEPYVLLAQMVISLSLLIYMGCVPRSKLSDVHNSVDIAFICVQLVLLCLLPLCWWHIADFLIVATALACAAARAYGGTIVITVLLLKLPAVVRAFFPDHSGTRTYCRAVRNTTLYLFALSPFVLAGVGATVRGACVNNLLLTPYGNWGRVFLYLWSALAPQYKVQALVTDDTLTIPNDGFPVLNVAPNVYWLRVKDRTENSSTTVDFVELRMPAVQVVLCTLILSLYLWASTIVGTHSAIRSHYDISDETKLKTNRHRFRNARKMELLDAHRAANMEALGEQLDGVMWEADVRAAKEAVDASHYDHNMNHTVHRFVRRVQDSVAQGNLRFERKPGKIAGQRRRSSTLYGHLLHGNMNSGDEAAEKVEAKWDCRNEDPRARGTYDIEVIEAALGKQERKGFGERFFERQWKGQVLRRESTPVLVLMLIMSSVRPNLVPMEIAFSSVLALELLLSLYFLRIDFIFSHYVLLSIRLFSVVVGFVPTAVPFVAFRALRLMEGWSTTFVPPGLVRWSLLYCFISFVTTWMIAFVSALQFLKYYTEETLLAGNSTDTGLPSAIICNSTAHCLAISLRELVLPAWSPQHVRPTEEAPLMATLVVCFQLFFIPFSLSIVLHPLLQLSNFIGRFLRLVVQSLHKDVLDYLDSYLEGESWYFHWRFKMPIPANVIVKLKMWVYDSHRRHFLFESLHGTSSRASSPFLFPQATFVDPFTYAGGQADGQARPSCLNEIISRAEFTTFAENEVLDQHTRTLRFQRLRKLTRIPLLHYANLVATAVSVSFLWVSNTSYPRQHAITIVSVVAHAVCICTNVIVFPKDITAALTFVGCAALLVSIVMILLPDPSFQKHYSFRYISLVLLGQLQVYPLVCVKRFIKTFVLSWVKVVLPVFVVGALAYLAELLRAQIFLVTSVLDFHNATFESNASSVWQPKNVSFPESILLSRCAPSALRPSNESMFVPPENVTYEVLCRRTPRPGVQETMEMFSYYFTQDAYIYYSIYCYWLLPALCVATCLAYLYWSGANLLDTRRLTVELVPLLEDPVTRAQFRLDLRFFRIAADIVLIASLVFGCTFSPSTAATTDDLKLFFGFEVGFTICGLLETLLGVAFAVHRSVRSWTAWRDADDHVDNRLIVFSDFLLLVCVTVQLLYYSIAVPLCAILLMERDGCFISPDDYATFFITLRFLFLLRIIPRQYALFLLRDAVTALFACVCIFIYFVGSASALADLAASKQGRSVVGAEWAAALGDLFRNTFTMMTPDAFTSTWLPLNASLAAQSLVDQGLGYRLIQSDYEPDRLLFILSTIGKAVLACAAGVGIAIGLVPLRANLVFPLPEKSSRLYNTLSGGLGRIVRFGSMTHDDMRPEARRKIQARKFARIFTQRGIPSWALPHLLEELNICRPARQRRFMFALRELLVYLPISEKRQKLVMEYMDMWDSYRNGAPSKPRFSKLPVFPPTKERAPDLPGSSERLSQRAIGSGWDALKTPCTSPDADRRGAASPATAKAAPQNPLNSPDRITASDDYAPPCEYVAPLRLVQAIALFELGFPADSSMGSKLWIDFFTVVQKVRAATLLQSLWRMYRVEMAFDSDKARTFQERMMIAILRRRFRKYRVKSAVSFRCHETFSEALLVEHSAFNPGAGHYDLLNRLRGHYSSLSPTTKFVIREGVGADRGEGDPHDMNVRQYVSQYLQQSSRRRSLSLSIGSARSPVARVHHVPGDAGAPSPGFPAAEPEMPSGGDGRAQ